MSRLHLGVTETGVSSYIEDEPTGLAVVAPFPNVV